MKRAAVRHRPIVQEVDDLWRSTLRSRIVGIAPLGGEVPARWLDPVVFVHEALGHRTWNLQEKILRSLTEPQAHVAIKACHNSSKTHSAAEAAVWFPLVEGGIVLTTAPVFRQVRRVMWSQIREFLFGSGLLSGAYGLTVPRPDLTKWDVANNVYAEGMTTDDASSWQGWKGKVLLIIDEAQGVGPAIFEALKGFAGGDVRILMIGNPLHLGGSFYDAFTTNRAEWDTYTISAWDTPNFVDLLPNGSSVADMDDEDLKDILRNLSPDELKFEPWPMLATRRWALGLVDNATDWETRVMGRFPTQASDALIPLSWLEDSARLPALMLDEDSEERDLIAGVDVGAGGEDESVVVVRRLNDVIDWASFHTDDDRGPVAMFLGRYRERLKDVRVDADGPGKFFADHMEDLGFPVRRLKSGSKPVGVTEADRERNRESYENLRTQMWYMTRAAFERREIRGITDPTMIAQLASVKAITSARGKLLAEPKPKMKKRGVKSPDRADAVIYAFATFPDRKLMVW
jgi:hypothetical protein